VTLVDRYTFGDRQHIALRMSAYVRDLATVADLTPSEQHFADADAEPPSRDDFFHALHPGDGAYIELRAIDGGNKSKNVQTEHFRTQDLQTDGFVHGLKTRMDSWIELQRKHNVYIGVATRAHAHGGTKKHCLRLTALFVDLDLTDFEEDEGRARAALERCALRPSIIVATGGGFHAYWLLSEPLELTDPTSGELAEQLLRGFAAYLGGDFQAAELARVLRVPGTLNHKYDPPRAVVLERCDVNCRYDLDSVIAVVPRIRRARARPERRSTEHRSHTGISVAWRRRLAACWLLSQEPAVEGAHGDHHTFSVCCGVAQDYDLDEDDAFDVLQEWNARCTPPWSDDDLRDKIRGVPKYASQERGAKLRFRTKEIRSRGGTSRNEVVPTSLENVRLAMAHLQVEAYCDAFAQKIFVNGDVLSDTIANHLWLAIDDRFSFRPSKELFRTVLENEARVFTVHPVRTYLDGLRWDRTPRIDTWLTTYGQAENTELTRTIGSTVLIAAVRRVRQPGCKFDELLVLESPQGWNKSTALRTLCPNDAWFSDDLQLGASSKESIECTSGKWIIEISELVGNKREHERLKSFLSRQVDGPVRLAYGHYGTEVPRQFIAIGTTNRNQYLGDPTGNRRYQPVKVRRFDLDALRRDRDQLWAEAAVREARGESIRLKQTLWDIAGEQQALREVIDPWEEILAPELGGETPWRIDKDTLWTFLRVPVERRDDRGARRLAEIMQRLGFTRQTIRKNGTPLWGWTRGEAPPLWTPFWTPEKPESEV
jgi:hypothetical protein